jgi:energy-coupling factor transporter transmembrane protein EcfT
MDTGKLKVVWGYSMLLSMNSLSLLKKEQERIAFNAKLRGLKWHQRYLTFFPLLVFAIRHSERGAMALVTRGISPDKEFYHVNYMEKRDRVTLISYFLLTLTFFLVG